MGSRRPNNDAIYNILTVVMLLGVLLVGIFFITIFNNPQHPINPFKPIIIPTLVPSPTATTTPIRLPPTFTPQPSGSPEPTSTRRPTSTMIPTNTPFSLISTETPAVTPTPTQSFAYAVEGGEPIAVQSVLVHPALGCEWTGVGGQIHNSSGAPMTRLILELGGVLDGGEVLQFTIAGSAAEFGYGTSGWEFQLGEEPFASSDQLYVQLLAQDAVTRLSEKIYFDTYDDCNRNLILINFQENE